MTHPVLADWTNAVGGAAVVGLGLFVMSVRPRTFANLAFVTFAAGFGGHFLTGNIAAARHATLPLAVMIPEFLAWATGVVLMALTFPRPVTAADRGSLAIAATVMLALTVSGYLGFVAVLGTSLAGQVALASSALAEGALGGYLVLLALLFRRSPDAAFRHQVVLTAAAITMYVGFIAGFGRTGGDGPLAAAGPILTHAIVRVALLTGIAVLWLTFTKGPDARAARNLAWLSLAMPLLGLLAFAAGRIEGGHGLARLAMVAILSYAILRHHLLGLDTKVRWGISRSTIAAAFITVFFIASEGAQILFGAENEWLGLVAAGALVFAIAPLQRAAERLAEKAVPLPSGVSEPAAGAPDRLAAYRLAIEAALRDDGRLTAREEMHLADLAQTLGVGAGDALRLRREVEARAATAGGDGL